MKAYFSYHRVGGHLVVELSIANKTENGWKWEQNDTHAGKTFTQLFLSQELITLQCITNLVFASQGYHKVTKRGWRALQTN